MKYFRAALLLLPLYLLPALRATAQADEPLRWWLTADSRPPALYDTGAVYISQFSCFKADFVRLAGINLQQSGSVWLATCSQRPFSSDDVNKILVVKNGRSYPQYRRASFTLNARIMAVSAGQAQIESVDGYGANNSYAGTITAVSGAEGFVATDNFDCLQAAIDSCAARGKSRLILNYDGTAYLVPQLSNRPRPRTYQQSLIVSHNLEVQGYGSNRTRLKWGMEDINRLTIGAMPYYAGFWVRNCTFRLKKMTLLSPDRGSTLFDHANIECLHGDAEFDVYKKGQQIFVDSSAIVSEDANGFEGWGSALYMNSSEIPDIMGRPTDTAFQIVTNSTITAQGGCNYFALNVFEHLILRTDTLNRIQRVQNTTVKGGARYVRKATGVDIQPGSDTLVVHDPQFSFYDLVDYERQTREPWICVSRYPYSNSSQRGDTNTVYWTQINRVINDSTALFDTATRPGRFYIIRGLISCSDASAIVTGTTGITGTYFQRDLYPGDELYSNDYNLGYVYIGTVLSIQSENQLTLTANAAITASDISARTPATALYFPLDYVDNFPVQTVYRRHGVRWPVSSGTLYTTREGGNLAAYHSLYISGNVGIDNSNCYFQPLRQSRRCNHGCGAYLCSACLVRDVNITTHNDQNWYPAAGELKIFTLGPGYGFAISSAENYETPPAKH